MSRAASHGPTPSLDASRSSTRDLHFSSSSLAPLLSFLPPLPCRSPLPSRGGSVCYSRRDGRPHPTRRSGQGPHPRSGGPPVARVPGAPSPPPVSCGLDRSLGVGRSPPRGRARASACVCGCAPSPSLGTVPSSTVTCQGAAAAPPSPRGLEPSRAGVFLPPCTRRGGAGGWGRIGEVSFTRKTGLQHTLAGI